MELDHGDLFCTPPGAASRPSEVALHLTSSTAAWPVPITIPGTVAAALTTAQVWSRDNPAFALDDFDWWIRIEIPAVETAVATGVATGDETAIATGYPSGRVLLSEGLATHCDVWSDDQHLGSSDSMFVPWQQNLAEPHRSNSIRAHIWLHFQSLNALLHNSHDRRDRPRWKTRLVSEQGLRRVRTSLLGRIPSWTPPAPAIGPWRAMRVTAVAPVVRVQSTTDGTTGSLSVSVDMPVASGETITEATIDIDDRVFPLAISPLAISAGPSDDHTQQLSFGGPIGDVELWWPHTHGSPKLYSIRAHIKYETSKSIVLELGTVGFRTITVDETNGDFAVEVNDVPIFCRGASWMPVDPISLNPTDNLLDDALDQVVAGGMNMLRVSGTTVYETVRFHQRCDELGILIWQDFMFANLDIPQEDDSLCTRIELEAKHLLLRIADRPSTAILCGGSEVEQQAAMMGLPREKWEANVAHTILGPLCAELAPRIPFVHSSPQTSRQTSPRHETGSDSSDDGSDELPFHVDRGVGHYFGVGAYLREFSDARTANVRFAAECLALANVPDQRTIEHLFGATPVSVHHPIWKQRVPRDNGAGWDFDDVRDHYARILFGDEAANGSGIRYYDTERYLDLARFTSADVMQRVASEWRRKNSACNGALIWFLRDLWPGAGWGVIDSHGRAKAPYYALSRAWQPISLTLTDEGINGLDAHLTNETAHDHNMILEAKLIRSDGTEIDCASRPIALKARSQQTHRIDTLFRGFRDLTWAYRFGPPIGELVRVRMSGVNPTSTTTAEAHHWIAGYPRAVSNSVGLQATGTNCSDGTWLVDVKAEQNAFGVHLDVDGFHLSDNWFHLGAGDTRAIVLNSRRLTDGSTDGSPSATGSGITPPRVIVRALNSSSSERVQWIPDSPHHSGERSPREHNPGERNR